MADRHEAASRRYWRRYDEAARKGRPLGKPVARWRLRKRPGNVRRMRDPRGPFRRHVDWLVAERMRLMSELAGRLLIDGNGTGRPRGLVP